MLTTYQRVLWSGFALSPALILLALPQGVVNAAIAEVGPSVILAIAWMVAFGAAHFARQAIDNRRERPAPLLDLPTLRSPPEDLPGAPEIRARLFQILRSAPPLTTEYGGAEPETPDYALRRIIERIFASWGVRGVAELDTDRLHEVWQLQELVRAAPDRAGELAQHFVNPDVLLDIRDRIVEIDRRRRDYDAQLSAFRATCRAWEQAERTKARSSLLVALKRLDRPDPDLWHKVIAAHDAGDPDQRAAALWCARQPGCQRASVALFLANAAANLQFEAAARNGDTRWLDGMHEVIENWNGKRYGARDMGLTPPDSVAAAAPILAAQLDRLAEITGAPRWPEPRGVFAEYHGRAPRPRDHWSLADGGLSAPPQIADYIEPVDLYAA
ncbi:hypothetical protein [Salipiger abyssi]|uniref:hypothetical protein n=1 Tax=Salipiger abyssi TaxID=1250539 RepID=UPI001A8D8948|nr:hypothetical protein [Salipiger abyssi]MBN9886682.1 hypothetical protein [Salipiger abyssi]